ncbi:MAG: VOC family protein [Candidatus Dormibacteraeota bacterium]|uniref:VOC family protein n=1 Tax=Candidatus Aeolococcus gillhamiae TaxID=3127015 RepID=A0A934N4H9_9BACT|nr:VOC family protein [Candidatus Dormibacteraeota bacterium]
MQWLPRRPGAKPATQPGLPHQQLDQQPADDRLRDALAERVFALPGVAEQLSGVSVPGARALVLDPALAIGPPEAFMVGREFAHLHPGKDHSLHMMLPEPVAEAACEAGWAELHPLSRTGEMPRTLVMVFAPRDTAELDVVWRLVEGSYRFARAVDERQPLTAATRIDGVRHVGLTVRDLERSAGWYVDVLGFIEVFRESHPDRSTAILRVPNGHLVIGLVQFDDHPPGEFSPKRVGLDHLCFAVPTRSDLDAWTSRLDECRVAHSGVIEMATSPIVNFKDPDGIALAFAIPPE